MNIRKVLSTVLVIIWMLTIFYFSHQQGTGSSSTSKKVTEAIVNILDIKKEMTEENKEEIVKIIEPIIRKLAHYTLYMLGGILIINAINAYIKEDIKIIICSSLIGVIYAVSDELHQLFVNGRSGKIIDVVIDSIGIFTGIAMYLVVKKIIEAIVDRKKIKGGE
ncbi:MAG: VanZ family protein [Clostridia bacterium]|nr:VanZ family protein [Clostridia bacterium]